VLSGRFCRREGGREPPAVAASGQEHSRAKQKRRGSLPRPSFGNTNAQEAHELSLFRLSSESSVIFLARLLPSWRFSAAAPRMSPRAGAPENSEEPYRPSAFLIPPRPSAALIERLRLRGRPCRPARSPWRSTFSPTAKRGRGVPLRVSRGQVGLEDEARGNGPVAPKVTRLRHRRCAGDVSCRSPTSPSQRLQRSIFVAGRWPAADCPKD